MNEKETIHTCKPEWRFLLPLPFIFDDMTIAIKLTVIDDD